MCNIINVSFRNGVVEKNVFRTSAAVADSNIWILETSLHESDGESYL